MLEAEPTSDTVQEMLGHSNLRPPRSHAVAIKQAQADPYGNTSRRAPEPLPAPPEPASHTTTPTSLNPAIG